MIEDLAGESSRRSPSCSAPIDDGKDRLKTVKVDAVSGEAEAEARSEHDPRRHGFRDGHHSDERVLIGGLTITHHVNIGPRLVVRGLLGLHRVDMNLLERPPGAQVRRARGGLILHVTSANGRGSRERRSGDLSPQRTRRNLPSNSQMPLKSSQGRRSTHPAGVPLKRVTPSHGERVTSPPRAVEPKALRPWRSTLNALLCPPMSSRFARRWASPAGPPRSQQNCEP